MVRTGPLVLESLPLERRSSQLDLELMAAETSRGLELALTFNADLFEPTTAERLLGHLETLLVAVLLERGPGLAVALLGILKAGGGLSAAQSGSSGGAAGPHAGDGGGAAGAGRPPPLLSPADRVAQTAPQSFDIHIWQLLAPLLAGARVEVIPDAIVRDPARLVAELAPE